MGIYRLGKMIRVMRKSLNLTQRELSKDICDTVTLSRIEGGKQVPSKSVYRKLMERMGREKSRTFLIIAGEDFEKEELKWDPFYPIEFTFFCYLADCYMQDEKHLKTIGILEFLHKKLEKRDMLGEEKNQIEIMILLRLVNAYMKTENYRKTLRIINVAINLCKETLYRKSLVELLCKREWIMEKIVMERGINYITPEAWRRELKQTYYIALALQDDKYMDWIQTRYMDSFKNKSYVF